MLITDYFDYYRLAAYIAERTSERIGIVMGVPSLIDLFDERNHAQLPGGILESFGRLFKNGLKLYVYPPCPAPDEELKTVDDIKVQSDLQPLYDYLAGRGSFVNLDNYRPEYLPIFSRDVLRRIAANDDSWESMVPERGRRADQAPRFLRLRQAGRQGLAGAAERPGAVAAPPSRWPRRSPIP